MTVAGVASILRDRFLRPAWMDFGACRTRLDVDFFSGGRREIAKAVAVCNTCAVQDVCGEYVVDELDIEDGCWGGMTPGQWKFVRAMLSKRDG